MVYDMDIPKYCRECGESELSWTVSVHNNGHCENGRLRLDEVTPIFILGCEYCSETMLVVQAYEIATMLNDQMTKNKTEGVEIKPASTNEPDNSVSDEDGAVELYDADPNCEHVLDPNCVSGIRCTKCGGWFCF